MQLQKYYNSVITCVTEACHLTIPEFAQKSHRCTVPGWNDYVDEKHSVSIKCIFRLGAGGKPCYGFNFKLMNKTSAAFKLALICCKQHENMMIEGKI
jgi:hypothetical protein